jgi:hypothetical protein
MSYSQKFDPPEAPLLSTESNPTTAPPPDGRRPQTIEKTAPPAPGEPPPSGLGIVVRVVGLWILLPLALMYLIKMLML